MRLLTFSLLVVFLLAGCAPRAQQSSVPEQHKQQQKTVISTEKQEVIADNLKVPWSIVKHGNIIYITERPGTIVKIENGELHRQHVELEKNLSTASEAGLLGFVLDPELSETERAYAYYTYEDNTGQFNRIVSLRLINNVWKEEHLLLDHIPSGSWHQGGRLKIGPDGKLYATTGDAYKTVTAQDPHSLGGKIIRMNLDGSIPSDNPLPNSYTYSYGHRNPQGIAWSYDGKLYASEHGNQANDEINIIGAGQNYGWPTIQGLQKQEGMISPLFTSGEGTTWAPSGMAYDNGKLYVAALRGSAILEFNIETGAQRAVVSGLGRIRDVLIEDQYLYFISNNTDGRGASQENDDKLYRIQL